MRDRATMREREKGWVETKREKERRKTNKRERNTNEDKRTRTEKTCVGR